MLGWQPEAVCLDLGKGKMVFVPDVSETWEAEGRKIETELVVWGPCVLCASSTQKISIPLLQMALDTCRLICK